MFGNTIKRMRAFAWAALLFAAVLGLGLLLNAYAIGNTPQPSSVKNVILFIGDGMGVEHVRAGNIKKGGPMVFETFEHVGRNRTASLSVEESKEGYTDSAAGGTAMSTGVRTYNSMVARDKNNKDLPTIIETAAKLGYKTGVVSSDEIDGATPASFLSHAYERHMSAEILNNMIAGCPADLIIGQTPDNFDTYAPGFVSKGFTVVTDHKQLNRDAKRLLGTFPIFAEDLGYETANLDQLVAFALDFLDNDKGFVLMVEGANIDKRSHLNVAGWMMKELMAFDEAVQVAVDWAKGRDDTLIMVTADHETGGLSIGPGANAANIVESLGFSTGTHTGADVGYYATGMDSDLFQPAIENIDIHKAMMQAIKA